MYAHVCAGACHVKRVCWLLQSRNYRNGTCRHQCQPGMESWPCGRVARINHWAMSQTYFECLKSGPSPFSWEHSVAHRDPHSSVLTSTCWLQTPIFSLCSRTEACSHIRRKESDTSDYFSQDIEGKSVTSTLLLLSNRKTLCCANRGFSALLSSTATSKQSRRGLILITKCLAEQLRLITN